MSALVRIISSVLQMCSWSSTFNKISMNDLNPCSSCSRSMMPLRSSWWILSAVCSWSAQGTSSCFLHPESSLPTFCISAPAAWSPPPTPIRSVMTFWSCNSVICTTMVSVWVLFLVASVDSDFHVNVYWSHHTYGASPHYLKKISLRYTRLPLGLFHSKSYVVGVEHQSKLALSC